MLAPGTQIGPYTVLRRLGAGGMGTVYLGSDARQERRVALKLLPPEYQGDPQRLAGFRREALTLALLHHPNIAAIYRLEEPRPGHPAVLVLELVEGESLFDTLERGPLPVESALHVGAKVAEALEAAHERNVIHRDLKPANVILGDRGLVKVLDFGIARTVVSEPKAPREPRDPAVPHVPNAPKHEDTVAFDLSDGTADLDSAMGQTGISGTPGYMSPEQIHGGHQDARTDVFAFGCFLFECLTGKRAFPGNSLHAVFRATLSEVPDYAFLPERTPTRIKQLIEKCLEKDRDARHDAIREVRETIEDVLGIRRAFDLRGAQRPAVPNNLPTPPTSFVGRRTELAACSVLLEEARLLTLTGIGGGGKTRLALEVAESRLADHPGGAWFVDLAPVSDPTQILPVVARALDLGEESGRTLSDTVMEFLASRRLLLLFDTCEHVLEGSAELAAAILRACPDVTVLATSQEPLGAPGETVYAVPPLETPAASDGSPEAIKESPAVVLFMARAAEAKPGFELDDAALPAAAEICRQLDGIPLAIELAAAQLRSLSLEQILAKLGDRFRLLAGEAHEGTSGQRTMFAAIQWSYDQLGDLERAFFRSMAVFAGGWTLDAACAVWSLNGDEFEALDMLTHLADKSMVVIEKGDAGSVRYRYLETVKHYAAGRLRESEDADLRSRRHMAFFRDLAIAKQEDLTGPRQRSTLAALDQEHPNLLAAIEETRRFQASAAGLSMAAALARYWSARGLFALGRKTLADALAADKSGAPSSERAIALVRLAGMALYQGDYDDARRIIEESLAIYRRQQDPKGVTRALSGLATVATYQKDFEAARRYGEEVLALYRGQENVHGAATALHNLGFLALCEGDFVAARGRYEEALALMRQSGDARYMALTLAGLGVASVRAGKLDEATAQLIASLSTAIDLEAKREAGDALGGAAELAMRRGDPARAASLLGSVEALRKEIGSVLPPEAESEAAFTRAVRDALGPDDFERHVDAGRMMPFRDASKEALTWLAAIPGTQGTSGMTDRENGPPTDALS